jgi:hypothetical protein
MNLKACPCTVGHGLIVDKWGFYYSFQNLGSWCAKKPVNQVPVSCVFHSGMLVMKGSNRFAKIKAIYWHRHESESLSLKGRPWVGS